MIRGHRCGVDDASAVLHVRQRGLRAEEHAVHVRAERAFELFLGHVLDARARMLFARVVHEHVEPPEPLDRARHRVVRLPSVADVAHDRLATPAGLLDQLLRMRGVGRLLQVDDRDVRPSFAKPIATARPIPLSPPVTSATLPASLPLPT